MKPWMRRRRGESVAAWNARTNRTCYACGKECPSVAACNEHEDRCPTALRQGRKSKEEHT